MDTMKEIVIASIYTKYLISSPITNMDQLTSSMDKRM